MTLIPLPKLAGKLRELTGKDAPSYVKLYHLLLDGRLPSETRNGRYFIRDTDLPAVMAAIGLTPQ